MSAAATHMLPPSFNTAQSSPTGTTTSDGAGGRRAEILRMTSCSFNPTPPARSSLHLLDGRPEHVRLPLRVPGTQRAPLGLRGPDEGVVGRGLRFYPVSGMARQEAHAGVQLAAGTGHEVLALLEHTAGVLPEPDGRLAAPEQQCPRPNAIEIDEHDPGPEVGGNHAHIFPLQG